MKKRLCLLSLLVWLVVSVFAQKQIGQYEYWFDDNVAAKTATSIAPVSSFQLNTTVPTTGLPAGLHTFQIRFKETTGVWSSTTTQFFVKLPIAPNGQKQINQYEYWFDNDYAGKTLKTITTQTELSLQSSIPTNQLPTGLHTFQIRFQDVTGAWSSTTTQFFVKQPDAASKEAKVVKYEYWFDTDYSKKNGQSVSSQKDLSLVSSIATNSLPVGLHTFQIRFQEATGAWSSTTTQFFVKQPDAASKEAKVVKYEYWFDTDYSKKNGQSVSSQKDLSLVSSIATNSLPVGLHTFQIRFQEATGAWSSTTTQFFVKQPDAASREAKVVKYEYWFDTDYSKKTGQSISSQKDLSLVSSIATNTLPVGLHTFQIRFQEATGAWSSTTTQFFVKVRNSASNGQNGIVGYEYWFDKDHVTRTEKAIEKTAIAFILDSVDVMAARNGKRVFHFCAIDSYGMRSAVTSDSVTVNNDILISSQADVEKYANIPMIGGNITIKGNGIQSLQSWSKLQLIGGNLRIDSTSLKNLSGLDNLKEIDGNVTIVNNSQLETLAGLDKLDTIANANKLTYHLQVEKNPALTSLCALYVWAKRAGTKPKTIFSNNGYSTSLALIAQGKCEPAPIFSVKKKDAYRQTEYIHLFIDFSLDLTKTLNYATFITFKNTQDTLILKSSRTVGKTLHLYYSLPKKSGRYDLVVSSQLTSAIGLKLNQNQNDVAGEVTDLYRDSVIIANPALIVTNQFPLSDIQSVAGYTEISFNASLLNNTLDKAKIQLLSPDNKQIEITAVTNANRQDANLYRIDYAALPAVGTYRLLITPDAAQGTKGEKMDLTFEGSIETPSVNLVSQDIVFATNAWEAGTTQSLTYKVKNNGNMAVDGSWTDVVYLSSVPEWNSSAKEIYRGVITRKIDSLGTYDNQVQFTTPNVIDGQYYVLVRCNVDRKIAEADYTDNTLVGKDSVIVSVPTLTIGAEPIKFSLNRGEQRIYKLSLAQNQNVRIIDTESVSTLSMASGQTPDINTNKQKGKVLISCAAEGNYYVLVSNNGLLTQKQQASALSVKEFDLEISKVFADTLVRYKTALVPVEIIGCSEVPEMYLINKDGTKYKASKVHVFSETLFSAEFSVDTLGIGKYDLYITCAGKAGIKEKAINLIDQSINESLKTKIIAPSSARQNTTATLYVEYANNGNVDIPAPLLILKGTNNVQFKVGNSETYTGEIHLMGLNSMGVLNRLRPGEGGKIAVQVTIPNSNSINSIDYSLRVYSSYSKEMSAPFYLQWLDVDPAIKPEAYTQPEWDKYTTKLRELTGNTWGSFVDGLNNELNGYNYNNVFIEARNVYGLLKSDANSKQDSLNTLAKSKKNDDYSDSKTVFEPGTLFKWTNQGWAQLINYEKSSKKWLLYSGINGNKPTYFISHGMNNSYESKVSKGVARAIYAQYGDSCNIISVDWSQRAVTGLDAVSNAAFIPELSKTIAKNLYYILNGNYLNIFPINLGTSFMSNFYLIGHSHGAHVCGMVAERLVGKPKRITALDASEEKSHIFTIDNSFGKGWGAQKESAEFIDYYKSSILFGAERLIGNDNFVLMKGDESFQMKFDKEIFDPTDFKFAKNHGYAVDWFINTINPSTNPYSLGFLWDKSKYNNLIGGNPIKNQWLGVINGETNKIECLNIKDDLNINKSDWHYPSPWYKASDASIWDFQTALSKVVEYNLKDGTTGIPSGIIEEGKSRLVNFWIENRADNNSIPKSKLDENLPLNYSWITTEILANSIQIFLRDFRNPVHPGQSIQINQLITVPEGTYKKLGGNSLEPLECLIYLGAGVNPNNLKKFCEGELYTNNNISKTKVLLYPNDTFVSITANGKSGNEIKFTADSTNQVTVFFNSILKSTKDISWHKWSCAGNTYTDNNFVKSLSVGTYDVSVQVGNNLNKDKDCSASSFVRIIIKPYTPPKDPDDSVKTPIIRSMDPNEKVNRKGAGAKNCLLPGDETDYTIYFENDPKQATAAAQEVRVIDVLDESFDLSTFSITDVNVANTRISIQSNVAHYSTITDLRPENNVLLKTDIKLDVDTRTLTATFTTLDTLTGEFVTDPWAGFLFPNDSTHRGEGHISFRINLKDKLADNYLVQNSAKIYFDYNDPIVTNTTTNRIDLSGPVSSVNKLPTITRADSVLVSWSGKDVGSGVNYYNIYVSENNGAYKLWKEKTTSQSSQFIGKRDNSYKFYSIAKDSIGFSEPVKNVAEAEILFKVNDVTPPVSHVLSLPATTYDSKVEVQWSGQDDLSAIKNYTVYVSENGAEYSKWLADTQLTKEIFHGSNGKHYSFFCTACDNAGNCEAIKSLPEASIQFLLSAKISRKWDDVLVCNNTEKLFSSYQWYKDNQVIIGETKQYYQEIGGIRGSYFVEVITDDGRKGISNIITVSSSAQSMKVYPNPIENKQDFKIEITAPNSELEKAELTLCSLTGEVILRKSGIQDKFTLKGLGRGCYIIQVILTNGESLNEKLIVN